MAGGGTASAMAMASVAAAVTQPPAQPPISAPAGGVYGGLSHIRTCSKCSATTAASDQKFCGSCGAPLESPAWWPERLRLMMIYFFQHSRPFLSSNRFSNLAASDDDPFLFLQFLLVFRAMSCSISSNKFNFYFLRFRWPGVHNQCEKQQTQLEIGRSR